MVNSSHPVRIKGLTQSVYVFRCVESIVLNVGDWNDIMISIKYPYIRYKIGIC
jgi:hypothetical protein